MTNFWEALSQVEWIEPEPIEYRVYHREDGSIIEYSNEKRDGCYITVPREIWAVGDRSLKVKNGKLISSKPAVQKYAKSDTGITCSSYDVCVIVDDTSEHIKWNLITYEQD